MTPTNEGYGGWIETQAGPFHLSNPAFDIEVIAGALGQLTRYNGHGTFFYSVAEHSVLVADLMQCLDLGDPFEGLMHDATEAYLSDVPAPFKALLPDWQEIDNKLDAQLREWARLGPKTQGCKDADWLALFIEANFLLPSGGEGFYDPRNLRPRALELIEQGWFIEGLDWEVAAKSFLAKYDQIMLGAAA